MQTAHPHFVLKSSVELLRLIGGLSLIACLALILTNPFKQTRHIKIECQTNRLPSSLVQEGVNTGSAECLFVKSMPRNSSLWVY